MKQKLLTLFALLLGVCSGAWGTSYIPSTVKTIAVTGNYLFNDLQQGVTDGWVIYAAGTGGALAEKTDKSIGFTDSDFGITDSNKGNNVSTVQVKTDGGVFNSNKRVVHMLVTNITSVKAIGSAQSGRGFQIGATEYTNSTTESTAMTVVAGNTSATNPVSYSSLDPSKTYIISIFAYSGDTHLYGVRFTADERPIAPISWPVSNYAATIGGSNTFPTLTNEGGMTVTYNSSKTGIATINETTGVISLVAQGTTTITATYTTTGPSDTYRTTKVSYELSVSNLAVQSNKFWNFSSDAAWSEVGDIASTTIIDNMEILADGSNKQTLSTSGAVDFNGLSLTKFFSPGQVKETTRQFHIRVAPKSMITVYIHCTGDSRKLKITQDSKTGATITEQTVGNSGAQIFTCCYTGVIAADLYIYNSGSNGMNIYGVKVQPYVSKPITAAGWATYCSPYALDLANATGLTDAYIVTGGAGGVLTKTSVKSGTVPANTGLLLKGDEGTATIPVVASSATDVSANKLMGVTANTEIAANAGYVLMNDATNGLGFYMNNNAFTVGANTSYLPSNFAGADARGFFLLDDATAIDAIAKSQEPNANSYYNLAGQRVAQPTKGLYIKDGKKVIIK